MEEKEVKLANRYELKLRILTPNNEELVYNYWKILSYFGYDQPKSLKSPLADIDRYTMNYQDEDHFHEAHFTRFSTDPCRSQFILLTGVNPDECFFETYIEYVSNRRPLYDDDPKSELKCLDVVYGENEFLKEFLSRHPSQAEYGLSETITLMWKFYRGIIFDDMFFHFSVERISGLQKYSRYTSEDSWLLKEIYECRKIYEETGNQFGFTTLEKLKHYKSLRAVTMIMTEYKYSAKHIEFLIRRQEESNGPRR